jgi:uncharacterized protein YggE
MKHLARTTTFALLLAATSPLGATASPTLPLPPPQASILTVTGEGSFSQAPDQSELSLEIVTNDANATTSASKNNDIQNALKARLNFLTCKNCDALRETSYRIEYIPYPPKNLPAEQRQPRYGYITTRSLSVTITPINLAGRVIDAAVAAGATNIGDLRFGIKNRRAAYMNALTAAMSDAQRQAETLATAGGFRLARIRAVNTGYAPAQPPFPMAKMMEMRGMAASAPTPTEILPGGPLEINAHVTVTYALN